MANTTTSLRQAEATLRKSLYPPQAGFASSAQDIVRDVLSELGARAGRSAASRRIVAQMAVHLSVLLSSSTGSSIRTVLTGLLRCGRAGRAFAARFVLSKSVSLQQLAADVTAMGQRDALALLHELLARHQKLDKEMRAWVKGALLPLADCAPKEAVGFLAELAAGDEMCSFALREVLLSGSFADWMRQALTSPMDQRTARALALAVRALDDEDMAGRLALSLCMPGAEPPPDALDQLARAGQARIGDVGRGLQTLLRSRKKAVLLAALDGLIRLGWPKTGKAMALLFAKSRALRPVAALRATLLPEVEYRAFLRALGDGDRPQALADLADALAAVAPDVLAETLPRLAGGPRKVPQVLRSLATAGRTLRDGAYAPAPLPAPPKPKTQAAKDNRKLLAKLAGSSQPSLAAALNASPHTKNADLSGNTAKNAEFKYTSLTQVRLASCRFDASVFSQIKLQACDLSTTLFVDVTFSNCTFTQVRMAKAYFKNCRFSGCTFDRCDLSDAVLADCSLDLCSFDHCLLCGIQLARCDLDRLALRESAAASAQINASTLRSCLIDAVDLSDTLFKSSSLLGAQLICSTLASTRIDDCAFTGSQLMATPMPGAMVSRIETQDHTLLEAAIETVYARIRTLPDAEMPPFDPEILRHEDLLRALADAWTISWQMAVSEQRMLKSNDRRLSMARERLPSDSEEFFLLLPYLLHTDLFEQKSGLSAQPSCVVAGYHPTPEVLDAAQRRFSGMTPADPPPDALRITAIYTIGSLGTIAQTRDSDIDYWICYDKATASPKALEDLKRKLDALSTWAMAEFELEAYFFPMSMDAVRANDFGLSDKESAGSAQALLLKEEFYRTALLVAGKEPAWWVTPPGAGAAVAARYLEAARFHPAHAPGRIDDFGHLDPIPAEEYFGASLWQIIKALHSPYKSVMKLGLLEKYADTPHGLPVSDKLKLNLLLRRTDTAHIDPYTVLFRELNRHYENVDDTEALSLLADAFTLKTDVDQFDLFYGFPARQEEKGFLCHLHDGDIDAALRTAGRGRQRTFARAMEAGAKVNKFMVDTYARIQKGESTGAAKARITPEDLTRLGRRIQANFAPKKHKIVLTPFLGIKEGGFAELHFTAEKAPGRKPVWVVHGRQSSRGKEAGRSPELLRKDGDPVRLVAWLVANRIFDPGGIIQGERTIAPLAVVDVQSLIKRLGEFFPHEATFEPDLDESLKPERVTKAFLVTNLIAPHDMKKIANCTVIYTTNWGEMFCMSFDNPPATLAQQASAFLRQALPHELGAPEMALYVPKRAQCPRPKLV